MALGVVHDLAVGVHPHGADTWALQDVMARGVTVGAPPDAFNQVGPGLVAAAVAAGPAGRGRLRAVPRHAAHRAAALPAGCGSTTSSGCSGCGGCRRAGRPPRARTSATTTRRSSGILALEAWRAGAVVVGEDLGTVEPWVRDYLAERGVLGTSILWFERDERGRAALPPETLAGAVPRGGDDPRPAADRRLPGRRAHPDPRRRSGC